MQKPINVIHNVNRIEENNCLNISIDSRKAYNKIKLIHDFLKKRKKTLSKQGITWNLLSLVKNIYENLQLTSYLVVKDWTPSPKIHNNARILTTTLQHRFRDLNQCNKARKRNKIYKNWYWRIKLLADYMI